MQPNLAALFAPLQARIKENTFEPYNRNLRFRTVVLSTGDGVTGLAMFRAPRVPRPSDLVSFLGRNRF